MKIKVSIRVRVRRFGVHVLQTFGYVAYGAYGPIFKPDDTLAYRQWLWEHASQPVRVGTRSDCWWLD